MPKALKGYRLAPRARRDLEGIWAYTAYTWSPDQADQCVAGLVELFWKLVENPELVRERGEFDPPVRLFRYRAHLIVYRVEDDTISVVRVLHGRQDWRRLLA